MHAFTLTAVNEPCARAVECYCHSLTRATDHVVTANRLQNESDMADMGFAVLGDSPIRLRIEWRAKTRAAVGSTPYESRWATCDDEEEHSSRAAMPMLIQHHRVNLFEIATHPDLAAIILRETQTRFPVEAAEARKAVAHPDHREGGGDAL